MAPVAPVPMLDPSVTPAPSGQAAPAPAPNAAAKPTPATGAAHGTAARSVDEVCNTLFTSAQANALPVAFFANLIWQESRFHDHAVSPKGAMGIAQFMPKVAAKSGLANPFDPTQALPASAKMLRELFDQFGNLGYVAAAYNAGTQRVMDWLERGRSLPRETRGYVMHITGSSVEAWRKTPPDDSSLRFAQQLPCRGLPAFAELEQLQAKQTELARTQADAAKSKQAELERTQADAAKSKQAELERTQADAAKSKQAELERRHAEEAKSKQAELERRRTDEAHRAKIASRASRLKTASRKTASRPKVASRRKPDRRPQQVAKAPAAKRSGNKRTHFANNDRTITTVRDTVRIEWPHAKHEASHGAHGHRRA